MKVNRLQSAGLAACLLVSIGAPRLIAQPGFAPPEFAPPAPIAAPAPAPSSVPGVGAPVIADVTIGAGQNAGPGQPQQGSAPHPTTYTWAGDKEIITDPGTYYYHFYYTGTVQSDARVLDGDRIERIPVRQNEWVNYRRWIIAKLTNYYQVANGMLPTALEDYQRELRGEDDPLLNPLATPTPTPTPRPTPFGAFGEDFIDEGIDPFFGGPNFGFGNANFDARAAAEWTFYYDQLVLWQYYCTRVLLNEADTQLIDGEDGGEEQTAAGQLAAAGVPGFPGGAATFGGGFVDEFGEGGFGGGFGVPTGPAQPATVREVFDPQAEYNDPNTNLRYRDRFVDRAQEHELDVYQSYVAMISRIDEQTLNQEKYEEWIANRQVEILEFADNWRKLREGETMVIGNTLFLITPEKLEAPPMDAINLPRTEKLTPQDLLNSDGTVKQPEVF